MAGFFRVSVNQFSGYRGILYYLNEYTGEWDLLLPEINTDWGGTLRPFPLVVGNPPTVPHKFRVVTNIAYTLESGRYPRINFQMPVEYIGLNEAIIDYPDGFPYTEPDKNYSVYVDWTEKVFGIRYSADVRYLNGPDTYIYLQNFFSVQDVRNYFEVFNADELVALEESYELVYRTKDTVKIIPENVGKIYTFKYHGPNEFIVNGQTYVLLGWNLPTVGVMLRDQPVNLQNIYSFSSDASLAGINPATIFPIVMQKELLLTKGKLKMFTPIGWLRV